jgi:hypothetical protein
VRWAVEDADQRGTFYIFAAQDSLPSALAIGPAGNPLVQQRAGGTTPVDPVNPTPLVLFRGALDDVKSKLTTSSNKAVYRDSSGKAVEVVVDAQSVRSQPMPEDALGPIVVVAASQNSEQLFAVMAQGTNPALVALDASGALMVVPFGMKPQSPKIFSGDSTRIIAALDSSKDWVVVPTASGATLRVEINRASLQWMCNPQSPQECAWVISNRNDNAIAYVFVEDGQAAGKLVIKEGMPLVQTIQQPNPAKP